MKRFALFAAFAAVLISVNALACEGDKNKEGKDKDKAPQAQTESPSAPVASTQAGK